VPERPHTVRRRPVCVESKEPICTRLCNKHVKKKKHNKKKKQVTCEWTFILIASGVALHFVLGLFISPPNSKA
jgi:hypothetical protein